MRNPGLRIAVRHSDPSYLLWYLSIVMVSCVGWPLAQYFRGQRSRYEPFRFDAVKKSLAEEGPLSLTLPSAC